jgi:hypothetical protein
MRIRRWGPLVAGLAIVLTVSCRGSSNVTSEMLLSRAERSGFEDTSRYDDVRTFIEALARQTPRVRVESFGRSEEGRDLPLLVIGDPPAATRAQADEARLPVVFVMANIHAGEVEGKEAVLHLARRLTTGDLQPLLTSAVWLFAPIYNADGNEKISLDNRVEQYGPIGGVGRRENAKGLDLNRDFMKLESSEGRGLVSLFTRWNPDVIVDLHTTNGSYHGYHLTYAPALNPNTDAGVAAFSRETLLPSIRGAMNRHGFRTYDYGNFATADALEEELHAFEANDPRKKVWRTYDARPRFGNNYVGLRNRIAILSEAYSYLDFNKRVKASEAFVEEIMRFVAANGAELRAVIARADAAWAPHDQPLESGIAFTLRPRPDLVDVLVGAVVLKINQKSGKNMHTMVENVATPTSMTVYDGFASTATRRVPREYIVPATSGVLDMVERKLQEHGVRMERSTASSRRSIEQFVIAGLHRSEREFQGHHETSVTGRFERRDVDVPAGSLIVRTDQPLGRLAFYLLEPESNDGLTTWNFFDASLTVGSAHPVLKSVP